MLLCVLCALCGGALSGCSARLAPAPPSPPPPPLLIHLPGVSGPTSFDRRYVAMLRQELPQVEVAMYDWTAGDPGMDALHAYRRNHEEAEKLAGQLAERYRADPRLKIYLTGHSGGTAIAVWLLEKLPPEVRVQSVLLLAPALSPEYDLTAALRHVAGRVYAFTSPADNIVLGAGTRLFGTMDGVRTDAAGRVGFVRPFGADPGEYQKLIAQPYQDQWMRLGNIGDHIGVLTIPFARQVLLPLLIPTMPTTPSGTPTVTPVTKAKAKAKVEVGS